MKSSSGVATRPYTQRRRAAAAEANTERIMDAALQLFAERPFLQFTLADVADRAGVGLQTLIRRVGSKEGLARAVQEHLGGQIGGERGAPTSGDPREVAAAVARQYERWGALIDRTVRQEDVSPALGSQAQAGRRFHRAWIGAAFGDALAQQATRTNRKRLHAQLVGVTGVELWLVLRREEGLSAAAARETVAQLISAILATATADREL